MTDQHVKLFSLSQPSQDAPAQITQVHSNPVSDPTDLIWYKSGGNEEKKSEDNGEIRVYATLAHTKRQVQVITLMSLI